ncbi:MAG: hypothetical protein IPG39_19480 [Bacteroidetes bacterium]|nr:hypothetical protein [Bacteroidota bacterium]
MKKSLLILLLTFVQQQISNAQLQNSHFSGTDNPSTGNFNFAEYDLTTKHFQYFTDASDIVLNNYIFSNCGCR